MTDASATSRHTTFRIRSGSEAVLQDVPHVQYYIESKLRRQAKCAIIGKWKVAKSFFAMQLGMCIAAGEDFLGYQTTQANVLYINFEISEEMFQQRIQDMHQRLGCDLSRFRYLTITDLGLDMETTQLDGILHQCTAEESPVEVLIIDPRWKAIKRDGNQDEVIKAFCVNVDKLIEKHGMSVIVVHHEGVATGTDKAGKGSTAFDAWLDGWFKITRVTGLGEARTLDVWSRDSEREQLATDFAYPVFVVAPNILASKKAKTHKAKDCMVEMLQAGPMAEREVRFKLLGGGHSEYAFWRARKELEAEGVVKAVKAEGQGNRKMLVLASGQAPGEESKGE